MFVEEQPTVEEGEIGIFVINGNAFIKELGKNRLISINPTYKPIPFHSDDSIYCCGKVLGVVDEYEVKWKDKRHSVFEARYAVYDD